MRDQRDVVIIGFGVAGAFLGLNLPPLNGLVTIFTGDKKSHKKSRGKYVYHGFQNIPGMQEMSGQAIIDSARLKIETSSYASNVEFVEENVTDIQKTDRGTFTVFTKNRSLDTRFVVVAIGCMDIQPEIPLGSGKIQSVFPYAGTPKSPPTIHYCLRCDGHVVHNKNFAVIGNTSAVPRIAELLLMRSLTRQKDRVTRTTKGYVLLHGRAPKFEESKLLKLKEIGIEVIYSPIKAIKGETKTGKLKGFLLESGRSIAVDQAFVSLGMRMDNPLFEVLRRLGVEYNDADHIKVSPSNETAVAGIYAAGDIVADQPKQVYAHWAHALQIIRSIENSLWTDMREKIKDCIS